MSGEGAMRTQNPQIQAPEKGQGFGSPPVLSGRVNTLALATCCGGPGCPGESTWANGA